MHELKNYQPLPHVSKTDLNYNVADCRRVVVAIWHLHPLRHTESTTKNRGDGRQEILRQRACRSDCVPLRSNEAPVDIVSSTICFESSSAPVSHMSAKRYLLPKTPSAGNLNSIAPDVMLPPSCSQISPLVWW
jgi:hypothetical protein